MGGSYDRLAGLKVLITYDISIIYACVECNLVFIGVTALSSD